MCDDCNADVRTLRMLLADQVEVIEGLRAAARTRGRIGQAIGIVRGRYGLDESRAFAVLARVASRREIKMNALALDVIATGSLPEAETYQPRDVVALLPRRGLDASS
ncbi:MAG: hypothetical protein JWN84_2309 [Nocardioides sp.]|jgi:hypothetical protein|nr:hypothetical protein [Nocardioides sp.]